jgi:DNA-directed RNA polymerase subunit RPC12/RpoP
MTQLSFSCPTCKKRIVVSQSQSGHKIVCTCGQKILVPHVEIKAVKALPAHSFLHNPAIDPDSALAPLESDPALVAKLLGDSDSLPTVKLLRNQGKRQATL